MATSQVVSPPPPDSKPAAPVTLAQGRYRLERVVGQGGMASVYQAYDERIGTTRAIKSLHPRLTVDPGIRKRFETEGLVMARVRHRNVVTVHDVVIEGSLAYLVMEYLDRGNVRELVLQEGPLAPKDAALRMAELLDGLQAVHEQSIVHRDIKPQNLLVDHDGTLKLADFGIARILGPTAHHSLTRTGMVMGTYHYMAPELHRDAKKASPASDVYAAAGTLFFLVTGVEPIELHEVAANAALLDTIPQALREVIIRGGARDPAARFRTARAMADALRALAPQLPTAPVARALAPATTFGQFDDTSETSPLGDEAAPQAGTPGGAPQEAPARSPGPGGRHTLTPVDATDSGALSEPSFLSNPQVLHTLLQEPPSGRRWIGMAALAAVVSLALGLGWSVMQGDPRGPGPEQAVPSLGAPSLTGPAPTGTPTPPASSVTAAGPVGSAEPTGAPDPAGDPSPSTAPGGPGATTSEPAITAPATAAPATAAPAAATPTAATSSTATPTTSAPAASSSTRSRSTSSKPTASAGKVQLRVAVFPLDATITVGDRSLARGQTVELEPGQYIVTFKSGDRSKSLTKDFAAGSHQLCWNLDTNSACN